MGIVKVKNIYIYEKTDVKKSERHGKGRGKRGLEIIIKQGHRQIHCEKVSGFTRTRSALLCHSSLQNPAALQVTRGKSPSTSVAESVYAC